MAGRGQSGGGKLGNRLMPPRFLLFLALLPLGALAARLLGHAAWPDALALGFDAAALAFLVSLVPLLRDASAETIRAHARDNDANRVLILVITSVLALVVMAALGSELRSARGGDTLAMAKLITTLAMLWLFANTVYALHYAHMWYTADGTGTDAAGIEFPGTKTPDYGDFAYFAFTLGMTFQTSDTSIRSGAVRRIALLHSIAAFVFNIGVIAFSINVIGGS